MSDRSILKIVYGILKRGKMLLGNPQMECGGHLLFSSIGVLSLSFGEGPSPTAHWLGGAVSHGSKPLLSEDDIPSQQSQLEVLSLRKKKDSGRQEGKTHPELLNSRLGSGVRDLSVIRVSGTTTILDILIYPSTALVASFSRLY